MYSVTIPTVWSLTILSGILAYIVAGGTCRSFKTLFTKRSQTLNVPADGTNAGFSEVAGL